MCPIKKMVKAGWLLLLVAGVALVIACKNPASGDQPEWPVKSSPNKTSLIDKIAEAQTLYDSLVASDDGTDVHTTSHWVHHSHKRTLELAMEDARLIADSPDATTAQIKLALKALTEAYDAAHNAKQRGTKDVPVPEPEPVDKSALEAKIAGAQALYVSVEVSEDGTDIHKSKSWVIFALKESLAGAIAAAHNIVNNAGATEEQVQAALDSLTEAYNAVNTAKQPGTSEIDKSALRQRIADATSKIQGVIEADDGSDVYDSELWALPQEFAALRQAIEAAEAVEHDEVATQIEVDDAAAALESAIDNFEPQRGLRFDGLIQSTFIGPEDEAITLSAAQTLSWARNDTLTVTVAESFAAYQWYVNGIIRGGETANNITLSARALGTGTHTVTVKVTAGGAPYTKTLTFTVN